MSPTAGVQVSVPVVFPDPGVNVAPAGCPEAASEAIASPSGSEAVTFTVIWLSAFPFAVAGAVTSGARSTLVTVITVLAEPVKAFEAVNVTV